MARLEGACAGALLIVVYSPRMPCPGKLTATPSFRALVDSDWNCRGPGQTSSGNSDPNPTHFEEESVDKNIDYLR